MTCTVYKDVEDIDLGFNQILFFCECDDGRTVLVSGQYCERFALPEILDQISRQLRNATIETYRP
jgi:hypothetical protein